MTTATFRSPVRSLVQKLAPESTTCRLQKDEVLSVPSGYRLLFVTSGWAWVSWKGKDYILTAGQTLRFSTRDNTPVISALKATLTIELLR